ncbi:MAG TPA: VWA domain-containing protein [Bacteroidales bacterium]|nr:VWA domain-containing protein [Bacteroidales bacterium]
MQLFRFGNPEFLYLLLLIPLLLILFILNYFRKKGAIRKLGNAAIVNTLMPELSATRPLIKFVLAVLALASMIIILARPQFGSRIEDVKREGIEVIIALDVSNSMLAQDIQPDRLERAKQAISRLVDNLDNDRIGLIVFAGDAYTQLPVTTDYVSAKMFLTSIAPDMVPKQGTAIGAAIDLGIRSFTPGEGRSKAMVIITDGENHEDDPVSKAEEAAKAGVIIHTIGIGSTEGVPIRMPNGNYLKDNEGNTVISKLDEDILKKIAISTNGKYVKASNTTIGLDEIFNEIRGMKTQELESTVYTDYNDQFQIFAALAILLLIIDFLIMERRNRRFINIRLFKFRV